MENIILTREGKPFKEEKSAKMRASGLAKEGKLTKVVPLPGGGFGLQPTGETLPPETQQKPRGEENKPRNRPVRRPVGARNILTAPKRKGYVRRFVTDEPGRIEMFKEAGYEVVKSGAEIGDRQAGRETGLGSTPNTHVGAGKRGVLMEIKKEWYDEDQQLKTNKNLAAVEAIRAELPKENAKNRKDGMYGSVTVG